MGLVNAVLELGRMSAERSLAKGSGFSYLDDVADFFTLPVALATKEPAQVIRLWLKVDDVERTLTDEVLPLQVTGVAKMDVIDYGAGGDAPDEESLRRRLLYKEPKGSNYTWSYAPVYKLGKSTKKTLDGVVGEFLGKDGAWRHDNNSRLFKLKKCVLNGYEKSGIWSAGTETFVTEYLEGNVEEFSRLWMGGKGSTLLLLGVLSSSGQFLWPAEIPQFCSYFRSKLFPGEGIPQNRAKGSQAKTKGMKRGWQCASCLSGMDGSALHGNLDAIFKFATFDKPGFLPGWDQEESLKVWPICKQCEGLLSRGRGYINSAYGRRNFNSIDSLNLYVIPEILGSGKRLETVEGGTRDFIRDGVQVERQLFNYLAKQEEGLVFHFLFWEPNQSQEIVHLMVEDVPPTRLRHLESLWKETLQAMPLGRSSTEGEVKGTTLDFAIQRIFAFFLKGAKNEGEKKWLRSRALEVLGSLLSNRTINEREMRSLAVSRFSGYFADEEWRSSMGFYMLDMARVLDFIIRTNGR